VSGPRSVSPTSSTATTWADGSASWPTSDPCSAPRPSSRSSTATGTSTPSRAARWRCGATQQPDLVANGHLRPAARTSTSAPFGDASHSEPGRLTEPELVERRRSPEEAWHATSLRAPPPRRDGSRPPLDDLVGHVAPRSGERVGRRPAAQGRSHRATAPPFRHGGDPRPLLARSAVEGGNAP
jgi:hypothetical protein